MDIVIRHIVIVIDKRDKASLGKGQEGIALGPNGRHLVVQKARDLDRFSLALLLQLGNQTCPGNGVESRLFEWRCFTFLRGRPGSGNDDSNPSRFAVSLRRWLGLSVYSDRAFFDKARQSWVNRDFGVIDNLDLYQREIEEGSRAPASSSFVWNEVLFNSFQAGYLKRLDSSKRFIKEAGGQWTVVFERRRRRTTKSIAVIPADPAAIETQLTKRGLGPAMPAELIASQCPDQIQKMTELYEEAVKRADRLKQQGYYRAMGIDEQVIEQYRHIILRDHFERTAA
jgi:hypothetical protein